MQLVPAGLVLLCCQVTFVLRLACGFRFEKSHAWRARGELAYVWGYGGDLVFFCLRCTACVLKLGSSLSRSVLVCKGVRWWWYCSVGAGKLTGCIASRHMCLLLFRAARLTDPVATEFYACGWGCSAGLAQNIYLLVCITACSK